MTKPKPARSDQAAGLARGFAADVQRQQETTAALVRELAGVQMPAKAGQARPTLEQLANNSGFSSASPDELAPVLRISGRVYR